MLNIYTDGYIDCNFGDDMMIKTVFHYLPEYTFYLKSPYKEKLMVFSDCQNVKFITDNDKTYFDNKLVIVGSGFLIPNKIATMYALFEKIKDLFKRKKKVFRAVIGCNISPFPSKLARWLIHQELKSFSLICVRDEFSYNYIKKHFPKKLCYNYPDILFGLPDSFLFPKTKEGCLGISAFNRQNNKKNYDFYQKISKIADNFIETQGKKVLLFAFNIGTENDLSAAYHIKHLCKYPDFIEIIAHDDNGSNIIRNFARCKTILAVRLHSIILALRMGIAFLPIIYSDKVYNMLKSISYNGYKTEIDSFSSDEIINHLKEDITAFTIPKETFNQSKGHILAFRDEYRKYKGFGNNTGL